MNSCNFLGRISSDIDYRVNGDKGIARFSIAVNRRGKDKKADFFRMVAFGKTADVINNYFHKGSRIAVECTAVKPDKYTNQNGQTIYPDIEFWVSNIDFVDTKAESQQNQASAPQSAPAPAAAPQSSGDQDFMKIPDSIPDIDELPFS